MMPAPISTAPINQASNIKSPSPGSSALEEAWQQCQLTTRWSRTVAHRGRTVLAMDCVLAGAEWQHGRPLNWFVRAHMTHGRRALIGAAIAVGGSIPLLIYIAVGPKDGNPVARRVENGEHHDSVASNRKALLQIDPDTNLQGHARVGVNFVDARSRGHFFPDFTEPNGRWHSKQVHVRASAR